jgi:hypothetical protein
MEVGPSWSPSSLSHTATLLPGISFSTLPLGQLRAGLRMPFEARSGVGVTPEGVKNLCRLSSSPAFKRNQLITAQTGQRKDQAWLWEASPVYPPPADLHPGHQVSSCMAHQKLLSLVYSRDHPEA